MNFDNISPSEWRWVAILSGLLVALTLIPFAWALAASSDSYTFMGILSNPQDGATYLSKINQGVEGHWLFELRHTPEQHDPAGFHLFYLMLGHVGDLLGLSNVVVFHLARVAASFFMFISFYQLGATIWMRQRPRRLFFLLTSVGSGFGWFALLFNPEALAPDLFVPEGFPLYAAYTNPHFPLAIGCISLIAAQLIVVFRPGYTEAPTSDNGGLLLLLLSIVLTIVSPPGILVLGSVLMLFMLARTYFKRVLPFHELRWSSMILLPALPFALYYVAVFRFNDTFKIFTEQNQTQSPNIILYLMGYGLLFIIASPGIWRAIKKFEPDGDQLMLCWVIASTIAIYIPFALNRRLFIGLIIPIVYFCVRAIEDYWIQKIPQKWQMPALIAAFVFILPSHILTFGAPLAFAVLSDEAGVDHFLLLNNEYIDTLVWLNDNGAMDEVILAAPTVSLWIPAVTPMRVVWGHPFETVPNKERLEQMKDFYRGFDCETLLSDDLPFQVDYVIWGWQENKLGILSDEDLEGLEDEDQLTLEDINMNNFEVGTNNGSSSPSIAEDEEPQRIPTADNCKQVLEEIAPTKREFGSVTLYILHDDAR